MFSDKRKMLNYGIQIIILLVVSIYFFRVMKPVVKLGLYIHPTTDDYWMSMHVYQVWCNTHSLFKVIGAAFEYAVGMYLYWDGNFLSMFLTSMSPMIFGDPRYVFTFFFMLFSFIIGVGTAAYTILHRRWHIPFLNCVSIAMLFTVIYMNNVPNTGEILYWWPGVANYTFFFGFLMFAHGLYALYWEKNRKIWLVFASMCMFLVGLGNPITALINVCLTVYELAYHIYDKRSAKTLYWIPMVCALAGLIIIVVSPGSATRIPVQRLGLFEVILRSFLEGTTMIKAVTRPAVYVFLGILAFVSFWSFYNFAEFKEKRFRLAPVVFILMLCLCYASFAPIIYAQTLYYGRLLGTCYFVILMSLTVAVIYVCGAFAMWLRQKKNIFGIRAVSGALAAASTIIGVIVISQTYFNFNSTAFWANAAIEWGTVYEYDNQLDERYNELKFGNDQVVHITDPTFVHAYIHDDGSCYETIGEYYNKTVIYTPSDQ